MKKMLLSSVALLGMTFAASAADLPRRMAPPPVFAPVPVFTWTGFYVGVNAGYGWGNDDDDLFGGFGGFGNNNLSVPIGVGQFGPVVPLAGTTFASGLGGFGGNGNRDGFVGGAQVGFNYQFTPGSGLVVGVEADIQWADFGGGNNNGFFGNGFGTAVPVGPFPAVAGLGIAPNFGLSPGNVAFFNNGGFGRNNRDSDWFATVRGRVGWAFDRVLVYATGGVVFTDDGGNKNFGFGITNGSQVGAPFYVSPAAALAGASVNNGGGGFFGRNSNNDVGWVLGGGVEWAFTNNLTFKVEGLWVGFDNNNNNEFFGNNVVGVSNTGAPIISGGGFGFGNNNNNDDVFIARVGVNYKFGL